MKGYPVKTHNVATLRYCQTLMLKDNEQLIKAYCQIHSREKIWKETLDALKQCGVLEMEIYRYNNLLFMIVELPKDADWHQTMNAIAQMPKQTEWENFVSQFQMAISNATSAEKWKPMERIFHIYE